MTLHPSDYSQMSKREYKKIIDTFISNRYDFLSECSRNITKNKKTDGGDLLAELVIFLYENQEKIEPYLDIKMLEGFSVSWMRLQSQHKTTPFNRKYMNNNNEEVDIPDTIENSPEICDEDYVKDLKTIYTDHQVEKIMKIWDIYPTLSKVNRILFDAYFMENMSYDKIKDNYTFFRTKNDKKIYYKSKKSIYNLMNELKNEIKKKL